MTTTTNDLYRPGLEGVIAAETRLSRVRGDIGELLIAGYPLEQIAGRLSFESMVFLLWEDRVPTAVEEETMRRELAQWRMLPTPTLALLRDTAAQSLPVMDALRIAAGSLDLDLTRVQRQDARLLALVTVARLPTIVAAYWRLRQGADLLAPQPTLSHAANYLYMLTGRQPTAAQVRGLETYLNTVIDHGLNASTFTARVIVSTRSDLVSAVVGAIGALKGPLHGGAPGPALDMVFEIGTAVRAEPILRAKLDAGERLMGFGHRVYKVRDPRADVLGAAAKALFAASENADDAALYDLALAVEKTAIDLLEEYKPGRRLQTNVEFYTALLLHGLGLDSDLFSPTFAISRTAGWLAHCFEQMAAGRLLRPKARFVGEVRQWD
jgi:citrate synthase